MGRVVAEHSVLPWVRDEIARLRIVDPLTGEPVDAVKLASDNAAQRDVLAGRLERANELFVLGPKAGGWTRERRDAEAAGVTVELDRLGVAEAVVKVPPVDWTWPVPELNVYLRAILLHVTLGPDMRPVWAEWRNRELRAD